MEKRQLNETFQATTYKFNDGTQISESGDTSLIDGVNIIGMVEGQFFQPDGMSRNKRWYPRALWENVLRSADVKNRLLNHTMFGEIGHSDGPVTDMTLRNGEASHIITDLWIDEKGRGMGRAYILNTQKGRDLKIYLGAGAKLKVSTRGEGAYLDNEFHDGCPIIDPDSYELQTVDFVLNPGFLETSAKLTAQKEHLDAKVEDSVEKKKVNEETTIVAKREGEMPMDMDAYVQKLEAQISKLEGKVESLTSELKTKEQALLEAKFVESAEVKKIKEEYAPFKKLNASAKTIDESMKRSQKLLEKAESERDALKEEVKAWVDSCGSIEQVNEAREYATRALDKIKEYQEIGSVEDIKELVTNANSLKENLQKLNSSVKEYESLGSFKALSELKANCEKVLPKLESLKVLKEYKKLGSVAQLKALKETAKDANSVKLLMKQAKALAEAFKEYKELGSVADIKELKENAIKLHKKCVEANELKESAEKVLPKLEEAKELKAYVKRAKSIIEKYLNTVGTINKAKELSESRKETLKKVNVKEALSISRQFGCTVESAAKLLNKYGVEKTTTLLESAKKNNKEVTKDLAESVDLIEEQAQMDEAKIEKEEVSAKDFVAKGMITNAFNLDALGKKLPSVDLNKLDGGKVDGENKAIDLLKKYNMKFDVEEAPKDLEKPKTAAEAEKEAKKIIKK